MAGSSGGRGMSRRTAIGSLAAMLASPSIASPGVGIGPVAALFPGRISDGGIIESSYRAMSQASARFDMSVLMLAPVAPRLDAIADMLDHAVRRGARSVISFGEITEVPVLDLARARRDVRFVIVQGEATDVNVASYRIDPVPGAFLAGVAAAGLTRTGIVGHAGAERSGPGLMLRAAFAHGLTFGHRQPTLLTGFEPDHARRVAYVQAQADVGADIVFVADEGDGRACAFAALQRGARAIGFGVDWTKRDARSFCASAVADPAVAVRAAIRDLHTGFYQPNRVHQVPPEDFHALRLSLAADVPINVRQDVSIRDKQIANGRLEVRTEWNGAEFDA